MLSQKLKIIGADNGVCFRPVKKDKDEYWSSENLIFLHWKEVRSLIKTLQLFLQDSGTTRWERTYGVKKS